MRNFNCNVVAGVYIHISDSNNVLNMVKSSNIESALDLSTGVAGLDEILCGGLTAERLYLIEGMPGAGKTTLALQFLMQGRDLGEKVLYCTLSETRAEIGKVFGSHGWNLDGIDVLEMAASVDSATGEDHYTVFRPGDIELGETTKLILERVEAINPDRVVIDSLSELRLLAHEPLRYRRQILGLKHYFAQRSCTVLLLDDRTVQSGDLQPQSIAHGVIDLNRVPVEYGAERRRLRIAKLRGVAFKGGYHDMTIRTGGVVVFPRIAATEGEKAFDDAPASSGMAEFDLLLGGGLDRGTSTLLIGPPGTGKSTLAMSLASAAADRTEKVAVFAFEENERIVLRRTSALGLRCAEHIKAGTMTFRHVLPAELSPGEIASLVREAVKVGKARVVVIDSLNGYLNSMPEEKFLAAQLHELLGYLNNQGVVTILVLAQRGMMGASMQAPVDVSYLADTVVMLRHFEAFGAVRKAVSVLKKRTGRHEDSIRELTFERDGLKVGEALSKFRGVLTGVPTFQGDEKELMERDGAREQK